MKTFEVYVPNNGDQKKIASVQADYFAVDSAATQYIGVIRFYKALFARKSRIVGVVYVNGEFTVADTEFLLAPPEPTTPLAEYFPSLDPCHAPQPDPEPTPRRRKSKGSTLGLD